MRLDNAKQAIDEGRSVLGIELGSTRIKACLCNEEHEILAAGEYNWENRFKDGIWTYDIEDIDLGLKACYAALAADISAKYKTKLRRCSCIGISAMMHGYFPFDADWKPLSGFRTWRNTITADAAGMLTKLFSFNIPQRWSIAHLYQACLNNEEHLFRLAHLNTLAGHIHHRLGGANVLGIGDASGMFPIDSKTLNYNSEMMEKFDRLLVGKYPWTLKDILPEVLVAGSDAGCLSESGAVFLDSSGTLEPGIALAPPEGDAGTGMVSTNSIREHSGNVSAGTSAFAMVVLSKETGVHEEIDLLTTPEGLPVAMVHCNNCTSDINAWGGLFYDFARAAGFEIDKSRLYELLFSEALKGAYDGGGLCSINYISGEGVTKFDEGRPLFTRTANSPLLLCDFMRANLMSALAGLAIGMEILTAGENVHIDSLTAHGGFFKTPEAGQRILSAACGSPVSVMKNASEGGAYGMALLAAYNAWGSEGESLTAYLDKKVFAGIEFTSLSASREETEGFATYLAEYKKLLKVERSALQSMI